MLTIYNSLTKKKEPLNIITPGKIKFYVCGNTVYDYCHLGHARTMVAFDVIVRHMRARGYDVTYVRNITDIDDKIIKRAAENKESIVTLTDRMIKAQREDEKVLNIASPDQEPKATDNIPGIISLIASLIEKKHAYLGNNGDVYFEVATFETYGKLSNKDLSGQESGVRVEIVTDKKAPLDFVLWKKAKPDEPSWPSPWGEGRPGWHIECSAMAKASLGDNFDIHGGGADLQFPHHENEIAQSECANGKAFANHWMHTGFLQINKEKMSKSLGNFFTIKEIVKEWPGEVVRFFLVASHYRSQLNYDTEHLSNANDALRRLYQTLEGVKLKDQKKPIENDVWSDRFNAAMDEDFNTPQALAVLFDLSREVNRTETPDSKLMLASRLKELANQLGLLESTPEKFLTKGVLEAEKEKIENLIQKRNEARKNKQWNEADDIRDCLLEMGVELLDSQEGTSWRKH